LSQSAQPAGEAPDTQALRQQWLLEDAGMVQARVALDFADAVGVANEYGPLGLALFDRPHDDLSRSLVILHGAGHATSDAAAQQRASSSWLAWGRAQATSHVAGQEVAVRAAGVDDGWNRGAPGFDWRSAWAGRVPGGHLQPYGGRGKVCLECLPIRYPACPIRGLSSTTFPVPRHRRCRNHLARIMARACERAARVGTYVHQPPVARRRNAAACSAASGLCPLSDC